jgi:hypothetical protein
MNDKFGIEQFALFNSAGFGEMVMPVDGVKQILGSNNVGKTSTISCLKLFYSDSPAKEPKEVWGGYEWDKTRKFYFHNSGGSGSWLVFGLRTERNGLVTVIFFKQPHEGSISRMIVRRPFDRSLFVSPDGSVARDINEVRARLSEQGVNEPDGIMVVDSPEDWRMVLVGNHPHKKAINLGIVPLASADNKTFAAFKKTLIRALTNAGFVAAELKEAIENAASVSTAPFSFSDGSHYAALSAAKADMAQARMALAAKSEFAAFKDLLDKYQRVAGEHHAMTIGAITRLVVLEEEVSGQLTGLAERTAEHGRLIAEKAAAVEAANGKHTELSRHAFALAHAIQQRRDELEAIERSMGESMDSRTTDELSTVVTQLQESIGKVGALTRRQWGSLIAAKQQELARLQASLALAEQGKVSIEDWVAAEHGLETLSAMRQAYCEDALLQSADMLDKSLLSEALKDRHGELIGFGPVAILFKEGVPVQYDKKPDPAEIAVAIAGVQAELASHMRLSEDVERVEVMREELARLTPLLADMKRMDVLRAERVSEPLREKEAAEAQVAAETADVARRAVESELMQLQAKNLEREEEELKDLRKQMSLERDKCSKSRDRYEGRLIPVRATEAVDEIAVLPAKTLFERLLDQERLVQEVRHDVEGALKPSGSPTALSKLSLHLQLGANADDFACAGSEPMRALAEAIDGADDKLAASAMTIKTQIGTAAASLKQILDSLADVSKRVESMNREIQSVKLSNLSSISISMQKSESEINEILDFIDLSKDGNDLLAMDVPAAEKDRIRDAAMRAFESGRTFEVSGLYSLQFRVESVTGEVELITDSGKTGSEGTRTMFQILSGVILTKSLLKPGFENRYALNMLVDESLRLDGSNSKELIRFILKSGFIPILANPGIAVDLGVDYEVFLFQKSAKDNLSYVTASKPVLNVRQKVVAAPTLAPVEVAESAA